MKLKGLSAASSSLIKDICVALADHYPECWTNQNLKDNLIRLLECSLGRVLANRCRRNGEQGFVASTLDEIPNYGHIADWLYAAVSNDSPWLQNMDEQGRPRKLMKCREISDLMREANRDMRKLNQNLNRDPDLTEDDEEIIAELADGFQLVRLLTPKALDLESRRMDHCVGHGGYDAGVVSQMTEIYSLREEGKPIVTLEVSIDDDGKRHLDQASAYGNEMPDERHLEILVPWLLEQDWEDLDVTLFKVLTDRDVHCFYHRWTEIPAGACFHNLRVGPYQLRHLPSDLTVDVLIVSMNGDRGLPENLTVQNMTVYHRANDIELPESLTVAPGGYIRVVGTGQVRVPEHLQGLVGPHFPRPAKTGAETPADDEDDIYGEEAIRVLESIVRGPRR